MTESLADVIPELDGLTGMTAVASGGFSLIYRAYQPALNRTVAIKIMSSDAVDRRDRERFSREMGLTGKLGSHPHIVDVYQHGLTRDGQPYLMMPWYDGGSLDDGIRDSGPMPPAVMLRLAVKVTSALGYAHRHGVLHRDVKPGNILLTALNEPVLADFGIAVDARLAGSATVAWTPTHAAPEILAYEEPTPRSDIWSLASTLYTALAGRPPFAVDPGNTLVSIQQRFRSAPPPFVRTDVPASLSGLLAAALAAAPEDRPADTDELIAGLQAVERELGLAVTVPPGLAPMPELARVKQEPDTLVPDRTPIVVPAPPVAPVPSVEKSQWGDDFGLGAALLPGVGTEIPDTETVVVRAPVRPAPRWSWKRRLLMTGLGAFSSLILVVVGLAFMAPRNHDDQGTPDQTTAFVPPVVSGLRQTGRSPTSITIAWHSQGAYENAHRVVIEGGPTVWLKADQIEAGSAVLTGLDPKTRYCLTVDVIYRAPQSPGTKKEYGLSSSERKCFSTGK